MAQSEHIAVALYLRGKSPDSPRITANLYRALAGVAQNHIDTEIIDVDHAPWRITTDEISEVPAVVIRRGPERFVLTGTDGLDNLSKHFVRLGLTDVSPLAPIGARDLKTALAAIDRAIVILAMLSDTRRLRADDLHDSTAYLTDCLRTHMSDLRQAGVAIVEAAGRDKLDLTLTDVIGASTALATIIADRADAKNDEIAVAVSYLARNVKRHCEEARRAFAEPASPNAAIVSPGNHLVEPLLSMHPSARKTPIGVLSAKFTVGDVLATKKSPQIVAVKQSSLLPSAADILSRNRMAILPVVDEKNLFTGVLSERDILGAFARKGAAAAEMAVGDVATRTVHACDPSRTLASVLTSMESGHFRNMPVVDGGQIRGIISAIDILDYLVAKG